jgi:uncharacterized protein YegL
MNSYADQCLSRAAKSRRGAILPLVAFLLPVLVILLGFSVDLAFMQTTRIELRSATDAAARAGAIELAESEDATSTRNVAIAMAAQNKVAGQSLTLQNEDIEIGRSKRQKDGTWVFENDGRPWNSVRVRGMRTTGSTNGPIALFFASFYGGQDFEPQVSVVSTFLNVDVCLVLDRSGSMKGQKLRDLKLAVHDFLDVLEQTDADEQVALASYSSKSRLDVKLVTKYAGIRDHVDDFRASGMTAIGRALNTGIDGVTGSRSRNLSVPIIILMTDGQHNTGIEPIHPAKDAAALGITVHTITFGSGADVRRMRAVADTTGGRHFHADNGLELREVFREIARSLPIQLTQ